MTIGELAAIMQTMDPSHDALFALFTPDGSGGVFEIDAAKAAADAFLEFLRRRADMGTEEEKRDDALSWKR